MKTNELARWLALDTATLRSWTIGEFRPYMSPTAQGGNGRTRHFTEQDARVLAFITTLKAQATPKEEIHVALRQMQTGNWADLPAMPAAPAGVEPISMIPREAAETAVTSQRSALMREIAMLQDRVEQLQTALDDERTAKNALQTQLTDTREQLGELRGKLSTINAERLPTRVTLAIVVAVVLGVLVIVAVVVVVLILRA